MRLVIFSNIFTIQTTTERDNNAHKNDDTDDMEKGKVMQSKRQDKLNIFFSTIYSVISFFVLLLQLLNSLKIHVFTYFSF